MLRPALRWQLASWLLLLGAIASPRAHSLDGPAAALLAVPAPYREGYRAIDVRSLRAWIELLASPELEGREAGTRGYDLAARFVAAQLASLGLEPLGDEGSYFQRFDIVETRRDPDLASLTLRRGDAAPETLPLKGSFDVEGRGAIDWGGRWVFAGFGESGALDARDDYHGLPIEGSVIVLLASEDGARQLATARSRGVERLVMIDDARAKKPRGLGNQMTTMAPGAPVPAAAGGPAPGAPPVVYLASELGHRILEALRGAQGDAQLELKIEDIEKRSTTANVVARLRGGSPGFEGQHVVVGAHLDHVGIIEGQVHPGADDDASGSSALLAVATAFAQNGVAPRRGVVFAFFGAEEKGLFGSAWFAEHSPVPLSSISVEIQMDMVGRDEEVLSDDPAKVEKAEDNRETLHVVGASRHSLELDPWVSSLNGLPGVGLRFEYDEERVYARSDQYQFGSRGVPVVFFFAGFHRDYHRPTDTPEKINYEKVARVSRLVFSLAFEVADRERRLTINKL